MASLTIARSEILALLKSLGNPDTAKITDKLALQIINTTFEDYDPKTVECSDPKLLAWIRKALKSDTEILIEADDAEEEAVEAPAKSKPKLGKKSKKAEPVEEEVEDEDDEEEAAEEAPKSKSKKSKKAEPEYSDVDEDEDDEDEAPAPKAKKGKGSKDAAVDAKGKAKKPDPVETEDDEDEDEEEAPAPKGVKKKLSKADKEAAKGKSKEKGEKRPAGPGVIDTIEAILRSASKSAPLTKADILAQLVEKLPDREEEKMAKTVAAQVPSRLAESRDLNIVKVSVEGKTAYYISKKPKA